MSNDSRKPLKTGKKAINLHTLGVQVLTVASFGMLFCEETLSPKRCGCVVKHYRPSDPSKGSIGVI